MVLFQQFSRRFGVQTTGWLYNFVQEVCQVTKTHVLRMTNHACISGISYQSAAV